MTMSASPQAPCRIEPCTWLITGATSGIGRALTVAALHRGDNVAALARHTEALDNLTATHPDRLIVVHTDVRDAETVKAAVQRAVATFGRIDVVANIAGYGLFGAVEESSTVADIDPSEWDRGMGMLRRGGPERDRAPIVGHRDPRGRFPGPDAARER